MNRFSSALQRLRMSVIASVIILALTVLAISVPVTLHVPEVYRARRFDPFECAIESLRFDGLSCKQGHHDQQRASRKQEPSQIQSHTFLSFLLLHLCSSLELSTATLNSHSGIDRPPLPPYAEAL